MTESETFLLRKEMTEMRDLYEKCISELEKIMTVLREKNTILQAKNSALGNRYTMYKNSGRFGPNVVSIIPCCAVVVQPQSVHVTLSIMLQVVLIIGNSGISSVYFVMLFDTVTLLLPKSRIFQEYALPFCRPFCRATRPCGLFCLWACCVVCY